LSNIGDAKDPTSPPKAFSKIVSKAVNVEVPIASTIVVPEINVMLSAVMFPASRIAFATNVKSVKEGPGASPTKIVPVPPALARKCPWETVPMRSEMVILPFAVVTMRELVALGRLIAPVTKVMDPTDALKLVGTVWSILNVPVVAT
jgi:hypothetical protein